MDLFNHFSVIKNFIMKYTSISLIPNISNTANHITFHSRNLIPLFKALSPR